MKTKWPGGMIGKIPRFNAANRQHLAERNDCPQCSARLVHDDTTGTIYCEENSDHYRTDC